MAGGNRDRGRHPGGAGRIPVRALHRHAHQRGAAPPMGAHRHGRSRLPGRGDKDGRAAGVARHSPTGGHPRALPVVKPADWTLIGVVTR